MSLRKPICRRHYNYSPSFETLSTEMPIQVHYWGIFLFEKAVQMKTHRAE